MNHRIIACAAMALATLAPACSGQPGSPDGNAQPSIDGMAEGLGVITATDTQTRMAYRKGDRVVFLETRRGEATPDEYLQFDPTMPPYGIDVRITDQQGSPIYTRITGDHSTFDDQGPELAATVTAFEGRQTDIALAHDALAAITADPSLGDFVTAHHDVVTQLRDVAKAFDGLNAVQHLDTDAIGASELSPASMPRPCLVAAGCGDPPSYKHRIELWKKHCCVPGGWHSATRTANWNGSAWVDTVDQCNHGSCPNTSGMSEQCSYSSDWRVGGAIHAMCTTGYGVTSTYSHNCNDDSHLQVIDVRHNHWYSTDDGSCHDFGANPDPDGCDPSTW